MMRWLPLVLLVGACGGETVAVGSLAELGHLAAPLRLSLDEGEVLLDVDGQRALVGRIAPPVDNADPPLMMRVRYLVDGQPQPWPFDEVTVSQAGLLPGGGFVVTMPDGVLRLAQGDTVRQIDEHVTGAVAVSADGRCIAYCKGEAPSLEVYTADLATGRTRQMTTDMAPTWAPGLSADGETLVFVSARTGVPALWIQQDGPPVQLTNVGVTSEPGQVPVLSPFPVGLGPTRVTDAVIAFESRGQVHVLDRRGAPLAAAPGTAPWLDGTGAVRALNGHAPTTVWAGGRP